MCTCMQLPPMSPCGWETGTDDVEVRADVVVHVSSAPWTYEKILHCSVYVYIAVIYDMSADITATHSKLICMRRS